MIQKIGLLFFLILLAAVCSRDPPYGTQLQREEAKEWKNRVYLASFPRSGNHWLRHLIEEATHIATSSVYIDRYREGSACVNPSIVYPWGGYCYDHGYRGNCIYPLEGETAVVKTHFPIYRFSFFDELPSQKTIRIIRHPLDSFYSFYVWEESPQKKPQEFLPRAFLLNYIQSWKLFQSHWDHAENVLTIRYEDLCEDPVSYLRLVLETIGYPVKEEDIERAVAKYPPTGSPLKHFCHYTKEDLSLIEKELSELMRIHGYELW